jgi:hypothetical protein
MRAQRLADSGYAVLKCDNRGSYRRGLAFEAAIKHDMGHLEIEDQEAAVNFFVSKGIIDPARVGIYGWSYGVSSSPHPLSLCSQSQLSLFCLSPVAVCLSLFPLCCCVGIHVCDDFMQIFSLFLWSLWCSCHLLGSALPSLSASPLSHPSPLLCPPCGQMVTIVTTQSDTWVVPVTILVATPLAM